MESSYQWLYTAAAQWDRRCGLFGDRIKCDVCNEAGRSGKMMQRQRVRQRTACLQPSSGTSTADTVPRPVRIVPQRRPSSAQPSVGA